MHQKTIPMIVNRIFVEGRAPPSSVVCQQPPGWKICSVMKGGKIKQEKIYYLKSCLWAVPLSEKWVVGTIRIGDVQQESWSDESPIMNRSVASTTKTTQSTSKPNLPLKRPFLPLRSPVKTRTRSLKCIWKCAMVDILLAVVCVDCCFVITSDPGLTVSATSRVMTSAPLIRRYHFSDNGTAYGRDFR